MITFYPGPSKLYPEIGGYLQEIFDSGILAMNHRSPAFMAMLASTTNSLKEKLGVPANYEVYYTSSATECWEIVAQSLIKSKSTHIWNGAFGKKWTEYTQKIQKNVDSISFAINKAPETVLPTESTHEDLLCLTHCETSNGYLISNQSLSTIRKKFNGVIAIDATASMAGTAVNWTDADVWFASVQKCFGLPSGLAVMIVSPKALQQAALVNENEHYNSFQFIAENFQKNQTPYTPNILGIALLGKVVAQLPSIEVTHRIISERTQQWTSFLHEHNFTPLITNQDITTVLSVQLASDKVIALKEFCKQKGIMIGNGYGSWKDSTFRIANFPAISDLEITQLQECLISFNTHY